MPRSAEDGWRVGRLFVLRIAVWLAAAGGYGVERVPLEGGGVVAANHFSGIDHPLIGAFSPRTIYFLAKAELLEVPVVGRSLKALGVFGVRRGEGDRDALRQARQLVRYGELVGVHLEGTRQRFGHPGPMQPGGLMIALQEGVPVIPCGLDTFGWSPSNRRNCAVVWGEPMSLDGLESPHTLTYRNFSLDTGKCTAIRDEYAYNAGLHADSECVHDLVPDPSPPPANETIVAGGIWAKALRQIAPRCA